MTNECSLQVNKTSTTEFSTDFLPSSAVFTAGFQGNTKATTPLTQSNTIEINLEDLNCFEVVERQFQHLGIIFRNAIALHPSNPAFPPRSGNTVLLAAPKNGLLEVIFAHPVQFFSAYITSSQRTILTAYNQQDQPIARTEMPMPNLAGSDSPLPPNSQLTLNSVNIHRVTFYAFDGQLAVDDLSFKF